MTLLSKDDILDALEALAQELDQRGERAELIVGGGAALVLLYDARQATRDIDLFLAKADLTALRHAVEAVSRQKDLPGDWLNDGAKGYLHGFLPGSILFAKPSLLVRALAPEQLLAMKLSAWRDDVDIEDARLLLSKIAGNRQAVWGVVEKYVVPGRAQGALRFRRHLGGRP